MPTGQEPRSPADLVNETIDRLPAARSIPGADEVDRFIERHQRLGKDPLQAPKFWVFVVAAFVLLGGGIWVAIDPNNSHTDDHKGAGMSAAAAALTGLGGLAVGR